MTSLHKSDIDSIVLIPHSPDDTIALPSIKLTDKNIQKFTDDFNDSKYVGPCKYYPFYLLNVYLKDGKSRDFRCNGQNIKENNDQCFEIGDHNYFDDLYKNK